MKLESLIIIFLLIIIPIAMVFSEYVDKRIETEKKELSYNTKLLNSTHDAIKEFQLRTVNNEFSYDTNNKIIDIESAINTFFTSLSSNFGYSGYSTEAMKEYVPAVVFTLYDGYYIYSPYRNTLTDVPKFVEGGSTPKSECYDQSYSEEGENYFGLKPYVYYSCRYKINDQNDFVITYTLDNYITIQGIINGKYIYDYGYIYAIANNKDDTGIYKDGDTYWYNGVQFKAGDTEELKEYIGKEEKVDKLYSYVKINGKKYYLENGSHNKFDNGNYKIFYIDKHGEKNYDQFKTDSNENTKAYKAIIGNKSAYEYYKNAYEFSERVLTSDTLPENNNTDKMNTQINQGYGLKDLMSSKAEIYDNSFTENTDIKEYGDFKIFSGTPQFEDSNFNKHRKSIIRYVVETNLLPAITSYASNSNTVDEFLMPKIKDTDWDLIENNVCAISFMQGMNIGSKKYNGYSVVANTLTKEYVDEDDIYIVSGNKYYKVNDNCFDDASMSLFEKVKWDGTNNKYIQANTDEGFYAGISKLDFEQRRILQDKSQTIYYYPQHPLGSYTSIFGSNGIKPIDKDMYQYIASLDVNVEKNKKIKEIYYKALGRERWSSFNINNINFELYRSNDLQYFLNSY